MIFPEGNNKAFAYAFLFLKIFRERVGRDYPSTIYHVQFGGLIAFVSTFLLGGRVVISFHGTDLHGGTPTGWLSKTKARVNCVLSNWAASRASCISVVSPTLVQYLTKPLKYDPMIIGTGFDPDIFFPRDKQYCKDQLKLDSSVNFVFFSDISSSAVKRRDIAELVIRELNNLSDQTYDLLVATQLPHDMIPFYLNSSECVLITSDKEGSPNIVKEALACGVPVVSVDVGDLAFHAATWECVSVEPRDPLRLAERVLATSAMKVPNNDVKKAFSLENVAIKTVSMYESAAVRLANKAE